MAPVSMVYGPLNVTPVKVTAEPVVLLNTAPRVADEPTFVVGNAIVDGDTVTLPTIPVPCKLTVCVLVVELSVIVSVPVRVPPAEGVKMIEIVQDWPALSEKQLLLAASAKSFPEICKFETDKAVVADAEFESTTFIGWLCVFTVWLGKTSGFGGVGVVMTAWADGMLALTLTVIGV